MTPENENNDDVIDDKISEEQSVAIDSQQDETSALREQITELRDRLNREMAENQNLIRRFKKQIAEAGEYATCNFARNILPVIDNLTRALAHKPAQVTPEVSNIIAGIEMTKAELDKVLTEHKVLAIEPKTGEAFDHQLHQAISSVETSEIEPNGIVEVMQIGYKLNNQLLRPAVVSVSIAMKE